LTPIAIGLNWEIDIKAAVLTNLNSPLEICEVELSKLKMGQVLVRVIVSGICGSQLHEIRGNKGNKDFLPHLLGHEGCGIVEDIGPNVINVQIGDKVVMHWRKGEGIEADFPIYYLNGVPFSSGKVTTLSEFAIVSENRLTTVPKDTDPEIAALMGCSLTTSLGILEKELQVNPEDKIAVMGCGGIGLSLILGLKLKGHLNIHGVDINSDKKALVFSVGANYFSSHIGQLGNKFDIIIDTTGNPESIKSAFNLLDPSGTLILVGQLEPADSIVLENANTFFEGTGKTIKATQGGKTVPQIDIPRYLKMNSDQLIHFKSLVTHRFPLVEINHAISMLKLGIAGRIMIQMESLKRT
jgi:Zn-dependent alcohol dehydrogenase